jgi:hypothetical protein
MVRITERCQEYIFLPLPSETFPQIYWTQSILDQKPLAIIYIREITF